MDVLAPGYNTRQLQQLKVYIAHLLVSRVTVYMSFLPAEWRHAGAASADYSAGKAPCLGTAHIPDDLTWHVMQRSPAVLVAAPSRAEVTECA